MPRQRRACTSPPWSLVRNPAATPIGRERGTALATISMLTARSECVEVPAVSCALLGTTALCSNIAKSCHDFADGLGGTGVRSVRSRCSIIAKPFDDPAGGIGGTGARSRYAGTSTSRQD